MIAAVGGLALAGAPQALADPILVTPADDAEFTARVGQVDLPGDGRRHHTSRVSGP